MVSGNFVLEKLIPNIRVHTIIQNMIIASSGYSILISNDYELDLIINKTGVSKGDLLTKARIIIVTLGDMGSRILTPDKEMAIPAAKARVVEDPTGAGDSYRGGLISGLVRSLPIAQAARMGSVCASFAVECYGTQDYKFTPEEFEDRFKKCYG